LRGGEVLDIGCGKGAFTARLKKQMQSAHILAIDIAPTAIKKAREKYGDLGIDFKVCDILNEYQSIAKKFDLIVMSQLMWYVLPKFEKIVNYLKEQNLKRDGYLLVSQTFYKPNEQKYGRVRVKC